MRFTGPGRAKFCELVAQGRLAYAEVATRRISRPAVVRLLGDHLAAGGGDNGGPASRTKAPGLGGAGRQLAPCVRTALGP